MSLRKPLVLVVLVVQLGHYIKSNYYVLLFSLRLRNPLVHIVLVVQLGHYFKSKFKHVDFFNEADKTIRPCRPGRPTWPLYKNKIYTFFF